MANEKLNRWQIYVNERFPIFIYLLLSLGLALSIVLVCKPRVELENTYRANMSLTVLAVFSGIFVFFVLLRLMDELKDFEKDKIAHPERPLPQGLFSTVEFSAYVKHIHLLMYLFSCLYGLFWSPLAGVSYLLLTVYVWLMFREFSIGQKLSLHPFAYALTHQMVMFPLVLFSVSMVNKHLVFSPSSLFLGLLFMGAFFTYEILRKLDPKAHPILKTYLSIHGPWQTCCLALFTIIISSVGAWGLAQGGFYFLEWLFMMQAFVSLSLILIPLRPQSYRFVEHLAEVNLLTHLWIVPFFHWSIGL